jgi:hypothetical protein
MQLARAMEIVTRKVIVNAEHSKRAWNVMLAAIEANKIPVDKVLELFEDYKITLLHLACRCEDVSVAVVQRLLELGASSSWADRSGNVAMHKAAQGCDYNSFEKCKMLPAADLGCRNSHQQTPLHVLAHDLKFCVLYHADIRTRRLEDMLRWMVDTVECPVDAVDMKGRTAADILCMNGTAAPYASIVHSAAIWKRRWTPQRAAWIAACCKPCPPLPLGSSF